MRYQQTIASPITCTGVGLHSGQPVTMTLLPAPPNTGVVFLRKMDGSAIPLGASISNLVATELCTAISSAGTQIKTIEHVLAALCGLGVDNVYIEIDAGEVPVMDGSAGPFVRLIKAAGIVPQNRAQRFLKITQPIESDVRAVSRQSITTTRFLPAGHRLGRDDVTIKRPGDGIPPYNLHMVMGRQLSRPVEADTPLQPGDLA